MSTNRTQTGLAASRRQGIALVVVLGFLAILTLMAVGMAISMRTERLASSSYLDMVNARLYCQAALADSMQCIEDVLGSPNTPKKYMVSPNYWHYFKQEYSYGLSLQPWGVLPSLDPTLNGPGDPNADYFKGSLLEGTALNFEPYYPENFKNVLYDNAKIGSVQENMQWIHTTTTNGADGTVVTNGRFMYLVLDISGAVDSNYVGSENIYQIALSTLARFGYYHNYVKFKGTRNQDHIRYETHRELRKKSNQENPEEPWSLATYSRFPPMRPIDVETNTNGINVVKFREFNDGWPVFLSEDEDEWDAGLIRGAFEEVIKRGSEEPEKIAKWAKMAAASDGEDLYNCLADYVDEDFEPRDLEGPSIEPVPMINEVVIRTNPAKLVVEVWSPFVGPRYEGEFDIICELGGQTVEMKGLTLSAKTPRSFPSLLATIPCGPIDVDVKIRLDNGAIADQVLFENKDPTDFAYQCDDPRFNHIEGQWTKVNPEQISLWNMNNAVLTYQDGINKQAGDTDGDYLMYCANRPLRVSGELGYLPVAPWRTIKLYEDPRDGDMHDDLDPVLDYFTLQKREEIRRGLVNPNSLAGKAKQATLCLTTRKSSDRYKRYGLGHYIDGIHKWDHLIWQGFIGAFENAIYQSWGGYHNDWVRRYRYDGDVVVNISDVGRILYTGWKNPVENPVINGKSYKDRQSGNPTTFSEFRLEDPMRRASHLFNIRQNTAIVCMWGQALGDKRDKNGEFVVEAEAQAAALIWRDPYPVSNENQHHRKLVRYMRWLE